MKKGYTLAETLIVVGIIVILAVISTASFIGRRNQTHLSATASAMAALLREAQSRSAAQSSSASWGVHFENSQVSPFFALFSAPYSPSSHAGYYALPAWVGYVTSSVNVGSSAEVTFAQVSGAASGSSSISIYLRQSGQQVSTTLSISSAGSVSY